ncbi:hypothetical protein CSOJ01_00316 [Colletotrichum sojae]|uniref:Uncharacterized protein n=1 Tax=Colletotrichum sojae TaxID=2175907 RepID=A0A8H6JYX7_9PEZI|nr:hypothetical protein CSOJ01_00316 [Colletotrichum sojae]
MVGMGEIWDAMVCRPTGVGGSDSGPRPATHPPNSVANTGIIFLTTFCNTMYGVARHVQQLDHTEGTRPMSGKRREGIEMTCEIVGWCIHEWDVRRESRPGQRLTGFPWVPLSYLNSKRGVDVDCNSCQPQARYIEDVVDE